MTDLSITNLTSANTGSETVKRAQVSLQNYDGSARIEASALGLSKIRFANVTYGSNKNYRVAFSQDSSQSFLDVTVYDVRFNGSDATFDGTASGTPAGNPCILNVNGYGAYVTANNGGSDGNVFLTDSDGYQDVWVISDNGGSSGPELKITDSGEIRMDLEGTVGVLNPPNTYLFINTSILNQQVAIANSTGGSTLNWVVDGPDGAGHFEADIADNVTITLHNGEVMEGTDVSDLFIEFFGI